MRGSVPSYLLALFMVQVAVADTYYFTEASDTDWHNASNWKTDCSSLTAGAVPGTGDTAVICSGKTAEITDEASAKDLDVEGTGVLKILDDTLTLSGSASTIDGELEIHEDSNTAELYMTRGHTLSGSGSVKGIGYSGDNRILIGFNAIFTNEITIEGSLIIRGLTSHAQFRNQGVVLANNSDLLVHVAFNDTAETGTEPARWQVNGSGAKLELGNCGASLDGDFSITDGELKIPCGEVTTSGTYSCSNCTLTVEFGCFTWCCGSEGPDCQTSATDVWRSDLNGDGTTDQSDLLVLLSQPCSHSDVRNMTALLSHWGPYSE